MTESSGSSFARPSRRGFLGLAVGAAGLPLLAACGGGSSGGSGGSSKALKFWDMPWGNTQYNVVAKKLVQGYKPSGSLPSATYQEIQWNNFTQTFASAVASKTGPAVSSGGGFQAFQFAQQGAIHYADNVVSKLDTSDFLPGLLDPFKTSKGYVAIPWQQDARVWWYNKALLDQAGATVPTSWNEFVTACQKLKAIGVYGYSSGSGAGNNIGNQALIAMMLNNGGGLFDPDGKLDCTYSRNVEAVDFVINLIKEGFVDPASVSYTSDNQNNQWKQKKFGMGIETGGLADNIGDTTGNVQVMPPMTALHGDKAGLVYLNNLMMYTESPSTKGSEAFLTFYMKNLSTYWKQNLGTGLPALKSIVNLKEFQAKTNSANIIKYYQPVFKTLSSRGKSESIKQAEIDSTAPLYAFAQSVLGGKTDAKTALSTLQSGLSGLIK